MDDLMEGLYTVNETVYADKIKDYKDLKPEEKAQVDSIVESYKQGSSWNPGTEAVERYINTRLNLGVINKINEKLDTAERSRNAEINTMRLHLLEDRIKKGYYNNGMQQQNTGDSQEVRELKQEVSEMRDQLKDLKLLLTEKLK